MPAPDTNEQHTLEIPKIDAELLCPEVIPGIRLLPVVHGRVDAAAVVRAVLAQLKPERIAVELPTSLRAAVIKAVNRLPEITVVLAEGEDDGAEAPLVWVTIPGDPFVEGIRWALENHGPEAIICIDPDLPYTEKHQDAVPDPYALWSIGPSKYFSELTQSLGQDALATKEDHLREQGMAWHLKQSVTQSPGKNTVALVGAAHLMRLERHLKNPQAQPLARLKRQQISLFHLAPECLPAVMIDAPLAHAIFMHAAMIKADQPPAPCPALQDTCSNRISFRRGALRVIAQKSREDKKNRYRNIVTYAYWKARISLAASTSLAHSLYQLSTVDRRALSAVIWKIAAGSYQEQTHESMRPWQRRLYFDFANRLCRTAGQLVPDLYHWVVAARGIANDNFAWETYDVARTYPWQQEHSDLPTLHIDGDELDLGTRRIRFRRRFFKVKRTAHVRIPIKEHPHTEDPEQWLKAFDEHYICSHEPESIVLEDYGNFIKHKGVAKLSEAQSRTEPFSSSFLDGIDIRETLRNIADKKIYVQQFQKAPGGAGSVILIFDEDEQTGEAYPYLMTWHGEHNNESDIAFYATNPADQVVGPGIMRATYGGLLMVYPPRRLHNVWADADYFQAQSKAEVLIMAGIDYSLEKLVMLVSRKKIPARIQQYAARQGKQVVHIPIGTLSPISIEKIRVVHLLSGANTRQWAKDYIW